MIRKITILFLLYASFCTDVFCQDFLGLSTGNYAGVTGVMLQPASIVDSRHKFDINIFSTGFNYSNNYFLVNRDAILKFNKNNFNSYSEFKSRYLSEGKLDNGEKAFFNINNRVQLPLSFMATTGRKSAIAFNMQMRSKVQGRNISADLAKMAFNNFYFPPLNNTDIDASGVTVKALNWAELGLTYGRVLFSSNKHFLKAAFTGKYLGGIASMNLGSDNLKLKVNSDSSFNFQTPLFRYDHNENAGYDIVFDKNFRPDANAFGFDAGLVYEYRGALNKVKYLGKNEDPSYDVQRRDLNKYIFKLGVSLLDAGRFTFNKPANVNSFSANIQNWKLKNANYNNLSDFDTALAARVTALPNDPRRYHVYLPTALSIQADVRFVKGLYLNLMSYHPVQLGKSDGSRFDKYGFVTITPRYERRRFGIYIPYTWAQRNDISNFSRHSLGLTLRGGPLFVGSSNLGSMLFNENLRAADIHLGLKLGITYGKPNKSSRILENVFARSDKEPPPANNKEDSLAYSGKLLMNYKNGNIYENAGSKGIIIIINNYYSTADSTVSTGMIDGKQPAQVEGAAATRQNQLMTQQQIAAGDSLTQTRRDSLDLVVFDSLQVKRMQIDSLIAAMQQLQLKIDSAGKTIKLNQQRLLRTADSAKRLNADTVRLKTPQPPGEVARNEKVKKEEVMQRDQTQITAAEQLYAESAMDQQRRKDIENLQTQQAALYRAYQQEALGLSKDIARLNDRLNDANRIDRRRPAPVITVPQSQNNNAVNERVVYVPVQAPNTLGRSPDTVYIRDTVVLAAPEQAAPIIVVSPVATNLPAVVEKKTAPFDYTTLPPEIVLFGVNQVTVGPIYRTALKYLAGILQKDNTLLANITGHTDPTGTAKINERLSQRRAEAVADLLKAYGAPTTQLVTKSFAALDPAVDGNSKADHRQNRRVEIKLTHK
jgi:outer membrane protein OmpA-like peptidoglycan-associated protein